jgi:alpha-1,6-mannosyltransferase
MVAAEARASGTPLIVPDRGAAVDQLAPGAGTVYRAASEVSLERAIARFIRRGPELQRAVAVRSRVVRTMDEHFADLFARYEELAPRHSVRVAGMAHSTADRALGLPLARPAVLGS